MLDEQIHLEAYDPGWMETFQLERGRLASSLGVAPAVIEHIGSTAVPGLLAKPVVDIVVGAPAFPPPAPWAAAFAHLGYEALGEPGSPAALLSPARGTGVQRPGDPAWRAPLGEKPGLRDDLRVSPEAVRRYEAAKRAAVAKGATTLPAYSRAKEPIVEALLREALQAQG